MFAASLLHQYPFSSLALVCSCAGRERGRNAWGAWKRDSTRKRASRVQSLAPLLGCSILLYCLILSSLSYLLIHIFIIKYTHTHTHTLAFTLSPSLPYIVYIVDDSIMLQICFHHLVALSFSSGDEFFNISFFSLISFLPLLYTAWCWCTCYRYFWWYGAVHVYEEGGKKLSYVWMNEERERERERKKERKREKENIINK